jgi:hypothetical protein
MPAEAILEQLALARRVADYAGELGVGNFSFTLRTVNDHLGAVLADAILQAGLNYRTVVRGRVDRILSEFPHASTMSGVMALIESDAAADFLLWQHPTKVSRFISLAHFLAIQKVETTAELNLWLQVETARERLLALHGIGPKTYDYLCCLVGIDCIAVDRHIKTFAGEAGVVTEDYESLKFVVSCAADLLNVARRDFDAWIWRTVSDRRLGAQLSLM